jgi:hypothetical protein
MQSYDDDENAAGADVDSEGSAGADGSPLGQKRATGRFSIRSSGVSWHDVYGSQKDLADGGGAAVAGENLFQGNINRKEAGGDDDESEVSSANDADRMDEDLASLRQNTASNSRRANLGKGR